MQPQLPRCLIRAVSRHGCPEWQVPAFHTKVLLNRLDGIFSKPSMRGYFRCPSCLPHCLAQVRSVCFGVHAIGEPLECYSVGHHEHTVYTTVSSFCRFVAPCVWGIMCTMLVC
jgi:hypothetical protein